MSAPALVTSNYTHDYAGHFVALVEDAMDGAQYTVIDDWGSPTRDDGWAGKRFVHCCNCGSGSCFHAEHLRNERAHGQLGSPLHA